MLFTMTTASTGSTDTANEAFRRARMRSRRGLLELDLMLVPFVEAMYAELSEAEQRTYDQLLLEEDTDLLDWLKGVPVEDAKAGSLIECIRNFHFRIPNVNE